jgi:hypothetical protein
VRYAGRLARFSFHRQRLSAPSVPSDRSIARRFPGRERFPFRGILQNNVANADWALKPIAYCARRATLQEEEAFVNLNRALFATCVLVCTASAGDVLGDEVTSGRLLMGTAIPEDETFGVCMESRAWTQISWPEEGNYIWHNVMLLTHSARDCEDSTLVVSPTDTLGINVAGFKNGLLCGSSGWSYSGAPYSFMSLGRTFCPLHPWSGETATYKTLSYGRVWHVPTGDYREWSLSSPNMLIQPGPFNKEASLGEHGIPDSAFTDKGIDETLTPELVGVMNRDGAIAGYVRRKYLIGNSPRFLEGSVPVVSEDGRSLVGHMYPGRGFVPSGQRPEDVPLFSAAPSEHQ